MHSYTYRYTFTLIISVLAFFSSCQEGRKADLIIKNGYIYTVDNDIPRANTLIIKDNRVLKIGDNIDINIYSDSNTRIIDANNQFVMPGFIEGHAHFLGLGKSLIILNFSDAQNWNEVIEKVADATKEVPAGTWIEGRGWHQEKWDSVPPNDVLGYPQHDELSRVSPDNPVILYHASGHALFANEKAMSLSGVSKETSNPDGGLIVRNNQGEAIGVFEENAMDNVYYAFEEYQNTLPKEETNKNWEKAIALAQNECLKNGVTSFQDAGSTFEDLEKYEVMATNNELDIRLWVMLKDDEKHMIRKARKYRVINIGNHHYTCRAIKAYMDGALGSRGAWLLDEYTDKPGYFGQNTTAIDEITRMADLARLADMQMCVHAIGDKGNRVVLDIYEEHLSNRSIMKNKRWRIEHAQHIDTADIPRFKEYGIIASMQGIHCTSDAPFVVKRLGEERAENSAYPWRSLLNAGVHIASGTDAPIEDINPITNLYAMVTRKRVDTGFAFYTDQKMTRQEALYSYTMGNAYAAFEESIKGSLTEGKLADIVILDTNLATCTDMDILNTKILYTIVGGEVLYEANTNE